LVSKKKDRVCFITKNSQSRWIDHISTEMNNSQKRLKRQKKSWQKSWWKLNMKAPETQILVSEITS